ncbi:MAG: PorT family protein [Thermoflexibacter sp.]|jgi:hypothetical protein|nr:PorT family protein [Thermoflexibacter sp.]
MKQLFVFICIIISFESFAQFNLRKIPIKPVLDVGFSTYMNPPKDMQVNLLGSRTINISMMYEVYITDHFTFNTGLGVSVERYSFDQPITLREGIDSRNNQFVGIFPLIYQDFRKSLLIPTYIDLPLELRVVTATGRDTFRFIAGFKVGVLAAAHTKIKYGTGDNVRTEKLKDDFFINRFRYGVYGRVGYKNVHLFTYYSLSTLFQKDKLIPNQEILPLTFGLSFIMF